MPTLCISKKEALHWSTRRDHRSIGVNAIQALVLSESGWPASLPVSHEHFTQGPTSRVTSASTQKVAWEMTWPFTAACRPLPEPRLIFSQQPSFCHGSIGVLKNLLLPTRHSSVFHRAFERLSGATTELGFLLWRQDMPIICQSWAPRWTMWV